MRIKKYSKPEMAYMEIDACSNILTGSIVTKNTIKSAGQEVGDIYDLTTGMGAESGQSFNVNWE